MTFGINMLKNIFFLHIKCKQITLGISLLKNIFILHTSTTSLRKQYYEGYYFILFYLFSRVGSIKCQGNGVVEAIPRRLTLQCL